MTTEKFNIFKITTKKGLIFEIILADWLKEGDYEFGKVERTGTLDPEQGNDYINAVEKLYEMGGENDE